MILSAVPCNLLLKQSLAVLLKKDEMGVFTRDYRADTVALIVSHRHVDVKLGRSILIMGNAYMVFGNIAR